MGLHRRMSHLPEGHNLLYGSLGSYIHGTHQHLVTNLLQFSRAKRGKVQKNLHLLTKVAFGQHSGRGGVATITWAL